jgi:hypothetical protein
MNYGARKCEASTLGRLQLNELPDARSTDTDLRNELGQVLVDTSEVYAPAEECSFCYFPS